MQTQQITFDMSKIASTLIGRDNSLINTSLACQASLLLCLKAALIKLLFKDEKKEKSTVSESEATEVTAIILSSALIR